MAILRNQNKMTDFLMILDLGMFTSYDHIKKPK